jgi:hypothetical protein
MNTWNPNMDTFMEEIIPNHRLRVLDGKDAARTYRLDVFRPCRLARHWRRSGRHGCFVTAASYRSSSVSYATCQVTLPRVVQNLTRLSNAGCCCSQHEVSFLALVTSAGSSSPKSRIKKTATHTSCKLVMQVIAFQLTAFVDLIGIAKTANSRCINKHAFRIGAFAATCQTNVPAVALKKLSGGTLCLQLSRH